MRRRRSGRRGGRERLAGGRLTAGGAVAGYSVSELGAQPQCHRRGAGGYPDRDGADPGKRAVAAGRGLVDHGAPGGAGVRPAGLAASYRASWF